MGKDRKINLDRLRLLNTMRQTQTVPRGGLGELGSTGLARSGGHIIEEWHRNLIGQRGAPVYREIYDNEPIVGAIFNLLHLLIRQMDWRADPADDSAESIKWAAHLEDSMNSMEMTWKDAITEMLSFLVYGFWIGEIVYSREPSGLIGWKKIETRAQDSVFDWIYDKKDKNVVAFTQQPRTNAKHATIPLNKCVHLTYRAERRNPEGRSMLRNLYTSYTAAKTLRWIEGVGFERNVNGMPVFFVPPELLTEDESDQDALDLVNTLYEIVQQVGKDERMGAVLPGALNADGSNSGFDFQLMSAGSAMSGQGQIDQAIRRNEVNMARVLGAEFVMMGGVEGGAYAMHDDKTTIFAIQMDGIADMMESAVNSQAVAPLMRLNGVDKKHMPKARHGEIHKRSLTQFASALQALVGSALLTPTPEDESFLREHAGLPTRRKDRGAL